VSNVKLTFVLHIFFNVCQPVVRIQYVTIRQPVYTRHFIRVIQNLHVSAARDSHLQVSLSRNTKKKSHRCSYTYNSKHLPLHNVFINITFGKHFYDILKHGKNNTKIGNNSQESSGMVIGRANVGGYKCGSGEPIVRWYLVR